MTEITITEAAERAGITTARLRVLCAQNKIKARKIAPRLWLIDEGSLTEWMKDPAKHRAGHPFKLSENEPRSAP